MVNVPSSVIVLSVITRPPIVKSVVASQVVHADIHKSIIKKLNPKLLDIISADKI